MQQVLWIFRKDVWHLRYWIAVTWAIQAAYGWLNVRSVPVNTPEASGINNLAGLSAVLLVLAWWSLIAVAVQEEALPGNKQFWLTRPYVRHELLSAKLLFVFVFICLPWLVSDLAILAAEGLPVAGNLGPILLRQVACYVLFLLPALLLAMVTAGIRQFAGAWFLALLSFIVITIALRHGQGMSVMINFGGDWLSEWVGRALAILASAVFLIWLYGNRRVNTGRIVLGVVAAWIFFGPRLPIPKRSVVNSRTPATIATSAIQLTYQERTGEQRAAINSATRAQSFVQAYVGVAVTGLPPEVEISGVEQRGTYRLATGSELHRFWPGWSSLMYDRGYWQFVSLPDKRYRALKAERLTLRTSFRLTAFTAVVTNRIAGNESGLVRMRDIGDCRVDRSNVGLICKAGVWEPQETKVVLKAPGLPPFLAVMGENFESPYPFIVGLSPVDKWFVSLKANTSVRTASVDAPGAMVELSPKKPLGVFERGLVLRDVRLEDYVPDSE